MRNPRCLFWLLAVAPAAFGEIELNIPGAGPGGTGAAAPPRIVLPETEDYGVLELANGERLKVAVQRLDPTSGVLTARHPLMRAPLDIEASALLRFSAEPLRADLVELPGFVVELKDGDRLRGTEIAMDAERLRFRSLYGGEISVPRAAVQSLRTSAAKSLYDGPTPGEEWTVGGVRVYVESPALTLAKEEVVGRIIPGMGRKVRLGFTIAGSYFVQGLQVNFFAQRPGLGMGQNNSGYQLLLSSQSQMVLRRFLPGQGAQDVGSDKSPLQSLGARLMMNGVRITILADLDEQRFQILSGGRPFAEFKDKVKFPGPGRAISFSSSNPAVVSGITVSNWDGRLVAAKNPTADDIEDVLRLKNGDTVSGELVSLRRDQVTLRTAMGELNIPMTQIESLAFRKSESAAEEQAPTDRVRLLMLDDSRLTVALQKIEDGVVWAEHAHAGPLRIPFKAVERLVWRWKTDATAPSEVSGDRQADPPMLQQGRALPGEANRPAVNEGRAAP